MFNIACLSLALLAPLVLCWPRASNLVELKVKINAEGQCISHFFRDTQHHRDMPKRGLLVEWSKTQDIVRIYGRDRDRIHSELLNICAPPRMTIKPLIISGPSDNRVDLVFFSDGYTIDESEKFFANAHRLAHDISSNQTFHSVKPLLNFWASFSPSNESGIGTGGIPKDTVYGLFREGTELRGVMYDKPEVAHAACKSMSHRCDYPILMGNDPLYGGLGGDFTVITPSIANGALVLRHELGHSIIEVGEEYDGGFAYFGPNAAHNLSSLPWAHWLSNPNEIEIKAERSVVPLQMYPWTMLNVSSVWRTTFISSGLYQRHLIKFSLSGLPSAEDLSIFVDGENLPWKPREDIGIDRWHYEISRNQSLDEGEHEIFFRLEEKEREGQGQLCSVEVIEFGDESEFNTTRGHYSAYPVSSDENETSYRPTNSDCLMRTVTEPNFCSACLEGLWLQLLKRVELIDDLRTSCTTDGRVKFEVDLVPLAQLREESYVGTAKERYLVRWSKDHILMSEFDDQTSVTLDPENAVGLWSVVVEFKTEEVRVDSNKLRGFSGFIISEDDCAI